MRCFERLVRLEGFTALAIAVLGMFAVMQLGVTELVLELALRRAVGAGRRHIFGYVIARAVAVALAGVGIGLWIGEMTSGGLESAVAGLPPRDLELVLRPALGLVIAALAGALIPAWRATTAGPAATTAALVG